MGDGGRSPAARLRARTASAARHSAGTSSGSHAHTEQSRTAHMLSSGQ